ncbi:HD domain-containing protein [Mariniblastus sp.]|nr:HD domain-containing protein [Mariniblastus sp.]
MQKFLDKIQRRGGTAMLIGGAVSDSIKGLPIKDWDIEVYGLDLSVIESILTEEGRKFDVVGKSFGVLKTFMEVDGEIVDVDLSVPRAENKIGVGHKDFAILLDPNMTPTEAGRRRDLTINSMYRNLHTDEIVDPFNGLEDLNKGIIRVTDEQTFVEDPLRVLRIMQLLPRKGKVVDPKTMELCQTMVDEFVHLPNERVFEEFVKLLLKAEKPSLGFEFLKESGWIIHFPELNDLIDCPQNPEWHPEGDVWAHTMLVVDNAAQLRKHLPEELQLTYMLGALLHDIGKPATTVLPACTATGHAEVGAELSLEFMKRLTKDAKLKRDVRQIVKLHMQPGSLFRADAKVGAWKRLHNKFRLDVLAWISKADSAGRTGRSIEDVHEVSEKCFELFAEFGASAIEPIVKGRHLVAMAMTPGPGFKAILDQAYELQLDGMEEVGAILKRLELA